MAGLDPTNESFRLYRQPSKVFQENSNLDPKNPVFQETSNIDSKNSLFQENSNLDPKSPIFQETSNLDHKIPVFQETSNLDHKNSIFQETSNLDHKNSIFQETSNLDHKNSIFQETSNLDHKSSIFQEESSNLDHKISIFFKNITSKTFTLDKFENLCPPKGENKVVVYTTTLRGVRKTFEACNTVRTLLESYGVFVCERDISMDSGFREELRMLMKGKDSSQLVPPRVFVKGRYIGGVDAMVRTMEDGSLDQLLQGLPKSKNGYVCEGCGGVRFLPCFRCNGSCKMVDWKENDGRRGRNRVVARCGDCNENGLVHCPICIVLTYELIIDNLLLVIAFLLDPILSVGVPTNNARLLVQVHIPSVAHVVAEIRWIMYVMHELQMPSIAHFQSTTSQLTNILAKGLSSTVRHS
ncbi:hypothetical protein QVD17_01877 [Tagetes erecta]|nr:hypothetical protein QVD17_01877 [Tagetes erecta]